MMFITFEGIEGSGKTTQIKLLEAYFKQQNKPVLVTKEPGATDIGLVLRQMILDPKTKFQSSLTEVLLFFADRLEHIEGVVRPALAAHKVVICDRFFDSTMAYQVGARGMDESLIQLLQQKVNIAPDLTILLDLDPEEGLRRAKHRASLDRFEKEDLSFHQKVRQTYLDIAKREPSRVKMIDVTGKSVEGVFERVLGILK